MDSSNLNRSSAMESPKPSTRKPFGEITNSLNKLDQTPIKDENSVKPETSEEALTPMANLKLLTRVASNEFASLPPKRELFREDSANSEIELEHDYSSSCGLTHTFSSGISMSFQENFTPSPSSTTSSLLGPPKVSRKQKSLGLLCEKFMSRFPESVGEGEKCEIPLDDLAKQMATERRRIYDIVNVLEAVQMMTKVGKNLYQWHGVAHRLPTLAWLRQLALKLKMLERYNEVKVLEESCENFYGSCGSSGVTSPNGGCGTPINGISPFSPSLSPCSSTGGPSPSPIERKTSLGVACQKFLMLFLIAPEKNAKINLDFAARVIHGINLPEAVMKTRIRRLYDIANILQSLQLIQKVQVQESNGVKKPAFQYIGPDVASIADDVTSNAISQLPSSRQRNSLLAVGKNLANIPDEEEPNSENFKPNNPIINLNTEIVKPFKKRLVHGFNFDQDNVKDFSLKRNATTSLLDLSNACEVVEKNKIRRSLTNSPRGGSGNSNLIRISPMRRSHIISPMMPMSSPSAVSLLQRKPLSPLAGFNSSMNSRKPTLVQVVSNSKTVIQLTPPTSAMDLSKRSYY